MDWKRSLINTKRAMFDLEKSITRWREQMLAAGIKTPSPLEELENHLREEIEQQMNSGASEQDIFHSAVEKIGQAHTLETEFSKNNRPKIKYLNLLFFIFKNERHSRYFFTKLSVPIPAVTANAPI